MDFPTTLPTSTVPDPMAAPPLRWGVLGPGRIARSFASALRDHTRQQVRVVGSRSAERAQAFCDDFGGRTTDYAGLLAADDVDVVYIATPHSEHAEQAEAVLRAGKPVLVEKAFTQTLEQAERVVCAARETGLTCLEAMWTRFLPHMDVVRRLARDGVLGELETVIADHGQWFEEDADSRLFAPSLAGGSVLDLGVYPLAFAYDVLGRPREVTARGTTAFTGVERQVSIILSGFDRSPTAHALLSTTLAAKTPTLGWVAGSRARIELAGEFYRPTSLRLVHRDGRVVEGRPDAVAGGLAYEAAHMASLVAAGAPESELMPLDESLAIMATMDAIRRGLGVR